MWSKASYRSAPLFSGLRKWVTLLLLAAISTSVAGQSDSKILLVYVDRKDCDDGCWGDTQEFRELFKSTVSASGLFKDVMSITIFTRKERDNSIRTYCQQNDIRFYMLSQIIEKRDLGGKSKYSIDFKLYDLEKNHLENPNLSFDISPGQPGTSNEKALAGLTTEINHFNRNNYRFKEVVKVESFEDMSPGGNNPHIENLPAHLAEQLNKTTSTNTKFYYLYVPKGGVNKQLDDYFINGQIEIIEEKDSLKVVFWMINKENIVSVIIDDDYWDPNEKKSNEILIKEVIAILRKIN